jgi:T-complex protein 1 subunit delta
LVELSAAQDIEAGDGTTSVVVLAGSLLAAAEKILSLGRLWFRLSFKGLRLTYFSVTGIHPTTIAQSFQKAAAKAVEYLTELSIPVDLNDTESLLRAASTSLNSKVGISFMLFQGAYR